VTRALVATLGGPALAPPMRVVMYGAHADDAPTALTDASDAQLITRTLRGDRLACDLLVRRHYRAAFAVALAVTADRAEAEDVCHDALVQAIARLESCRQPDRFAQWLAAVVRNRARNALARSAVRRAAALDPRTPSAAEAAPARVERDDLRAALEAALARLSPAQREVVLLHDLEGWTHDAIAASLGTSAGMSRQHLFKARRLLRDALGPDLLREYFDA
jgi:RNA polymerase sigma-70 factor (ECF subfamily)